MDSDADTGSQSWKSSTCSVGVVIMGLMESKVRMATKIADMNWLSVGYQIATP